MSLEDIVFAEWERFEAALPELLETYAGKWVVFKDGAVSLAHDNEEAALASADARFGVRGGFVVACVEPLSEVIIAPDFETS